MESFNSPIHITALDLLFSTGLVLIAGIVSIALQLKLERKLFLAALRTAIQLFLVGYVLKYIFAFQNATFMVLVIGTMIGFASLAAVKRADRQLKDAAGMAFITLTLSSLITTFLVTRVIIGVKPWYEARYLIPLLGMILGNALNGLSLCLNKLLDSFADKKAEVELHLSLGGNRWEAARDTIRAGVRTGMIPIINTMMVVGVVSLPGMMTGQIIAGASPVEAVKYQIVVMFMVAAGTSLGCILMALLVYRRLFNSQHQLQAELILPDANPR